VVEYEPTEAIGTMFGKVYFAKCGILGRCNLQNFCCGKNLRNKVFLQNKNLRKMMLLLLSFVIVCGHQLKIVS